MINKKKLTKVFKNIIHILHRRFHIYNRIAGIIFSKINYLNSMPAFPLALGCTVIIQNNTVIAVKNIVMG
jgi:hypothetical protein